MTVTARSPDVRPLQAPNLAGIGGSETLRIAALAAERRARGASVVSLCAGEPDFETPTHVRAAGQAAIAAGKTRYTATAGMPALREAIAEKLERENGISYNRDEVLASAGAKQALFNACMALFGPGDEVIVPEPYWVSYPAMVRLARATPVIVHTRAEDGYKMTAELLRQHLTTRTRGLILNSPSNPTGAVYSEEELTGLADVCLQSELWVLSDEIYERLCYDRDSAPSLAACGPEIRARTVTVNGFSKAFAMTGWRLGYAAAPRDVIVPMEVVQSQTTSCPSSVSQHAGLAALTERAATEASITAMREAFRRRRELLFRGLAGVPGVASPVPDGAFYLFSDVRGAIDGDSADSFCERLLEEHGLALVPGGAFGREGHVRWSFAASEEEIEDGVGRFRAALAARR